MKRLAWIAGLMLCLGACIGAWSCAAGRQKDVAKSLVCHGKLTHISLEMLRYHEKYGHFPPAYLKDTAGRKAHSWRVLLLEFHEPELFKAYRFDEPWDGPNNRKLESRMPSCYGCPADREGAARWRTNYFVVVGKDTVFPGASTVSFNDIQTPRSSTILIVESVGRDIHWMEPSDLSFDSMSFITNDTGPSISSHHRRGPIICTADCSKLYAEDFAPETLRSMCLIRPNGR